MPAYEYQCQECGKVVEFKMSIEEKDKFEGKCPECGGELRQVFSPTPFRMSCEIGGICSE